MTLSEKFNAAMTGSDLTVQRVELRKVLAPLPKVFKSAGGQLEHAAVLLIDLHMSGGITGVSYLFSPRPDMLASLEVAVGAMAATIKGMRLPKIRGNHSINSSQAQIHRSGAMKVRGLGCPMRKRWQTKRRDLRKTDLAR